MWCSVILARVLRLNKFCETLQAKLVSAAVFHVQIRIVAVFEVKSLFSAYLFCNYDILSVSETADYHVDPNSLKM